VREALTPNVALALPAFAAYEQALSKASCCPNSASRSRARN
jgi:hypothetical protein